MTATNLGPTLWRQHVALFRLELILLRRNVAAAALVMVLPLVFGVFRLGLDVVGDAAARSAVERMGSALGMIVAIFMHHHLVTVYASRRQELVLKRLRTGVPSDTTILAGASSAPTAVFLAQALVLAIYAVAALTFPVPVNPIPILLALLLASVLMATTAAVVSALTRSSEAAMITTFPTVALYLATPGILVPYGTYSKPVEDAFWYTPLGPFGELIQIGWLGASNGQDFLGSLISALPGLGVMAAWVMLTAFAVRQYFKWEPRHG